jgi:hypothetical protein
VHTTQKKNIEVVLKGHDGSHATKAPKKLKGHGAPQARFRVETDEGEHEFSLERGGTRAYVLEDGKFKSLKSLKLDSDADAKILKLAPTDLQLEIPDVRVELEKMDGDVKIFKVEPKDIRVMRKSKKGSHSTKSVLL